jgi:hypothetical protein
MNFIIYTPRQVSLKAPIMKGTKQAYETINPYKILVRNPTADYFGSHY